MQQKHRLDRDDLVVFRLLNLHSLFQGKGIEFRAFNATLNTAEVLADIQLCMALSSRAKAIKTASPARPETDNPKYTFRCWLLRLGFIGAEFKTERKILLRNLAGSSAFRSGQPKEVEVCE